MYNYKGKNKHINNIINIKRNSGVGFMRLNIEQQKLVNSKNVGHQVIRGIAGSGKTTVGVCRASYLLDNVCDKDDMILFLTYNNSLKTYIKYLYKKTKDELKENQNISFFDNNSDKNIKVSTIDSIMYGYFKAYCNENGKDLILEMQIKPAIMKQGIYNVRKTFGELSILNENNIKFLRDEIAWIKACRYTTLEKYQNCFRTGRSIGNNDGPSRLNRNSKSREAIFRLMEEVDKLLMKENKVDIFTANIIALDQIQTYKNHKRYKHIIIDEAQDLTKVQLDFINILRSDKEDSSILFLADVAQSIYPQAWLVKERSFKTIGYDMTGKGSRLSKNYRTTTEIAEAAYSLLSKDINIVEDENFVKPSLLDKRGEYPIYTHFNNEEERNRYLLRTIKALRNNYELKDIAIVSRINKNLELLRDFLIKNNIDATVFKKDIDFEQEKIKLVTMHSVKGLEFKVVILIDLNSNLMPYPVKETNEEDRLLEEARDRKLMYVGMTRAEEKLFLCSHGEPSKFINDIDKNLLLLKSESRINTYYNVEYSEYLFTNEIKQKEEEEESVRQWMIKELINNYGYPKELLKVEYPFKNFSRDGKADIVVLNGKTKEPYIMVETKSRKEDISNAVSQLKSYMNVSKTPFGVATNGKEIVFVDKDFNEIKDIPVCNAMILSSSVEEYRYIDTSTKQEKYFKRDLDNINEIIYNEDVIKDNMMKIPVYADIAAGIPIEIVDELRGSFTLPSEWVKNKKDLFILKVKGDSMINANIDNGDLVVLQSASTADQMDIVAVYYNGTTTLKRFMTMGSTVILVSENSNYEPINISEGDFRIMGKLVGILKS